MRFSTGATSSTSHRSEYRRPSSTGPVWFTKLMETFFGGSVDTGQQENRRQEPPSLSGEAELTVDHNGELEDALLLLVEDGEARGLDVPIGHPVHAPHEEALRRGSRRRLKVQKDGLWTRVGAAASGWFASGTAFLTRETSQPRTRNPVWSTEQLTTTGSPNLQAEGGGDLAPRDRGTSPGRQART